MTAEEGAKILAFRAASEVDPTLRAAFAYDYLAEYVTREQSVSRSEIRAVVAGLNRAIAAGTEEGRID